MDWQNERYVRLYVRDTGDMLAVGWEGRAVLAELLRKVDRAGVLDESDPDVLAELLRMPSSVVSIGLIKLSKREVIMVGEKGLVLPNFIDAQEAKTSDKQRQSEARSRRRDQTRAEIRGERNPIDSERNPIDSERNPIETVTARPNTAEIVTLSLAEPCLAVLSQENNTLSRAIAQDAGKLEGKTAPTPPPKATEHKPKKRKPTPKPPPSENGVKAASYLRDKILTRAPNCAASRLAPSALANWARDLDKLRGLSSAHDWRTIRESIDWLHEAENTFVVQSAASLAKKWDSIQANRKKSPITGATKPEDPYDRAERLRGQK